jgi:hypothetical protein
MAIPQTGRYMICGKPAHCIVRPGRIQIHFEDQSYTCMDFDTFRKWKPKPLSWKSRPKQMPAADAA